MKEDKSEVLLGKQTRQPRKGKIGGIAAALVRNQLPEAAQAEIDRLLNGLTAACGSSGPSAKQSAILHGIRGLLAVQWRHLARVQRGGRGARRATEALLSVSNSLLRHLKQLEIATKPRPRTLADLVARQTPENVQKSAQELSKVSA